MGRRPCKQQARFSADLLHEEPRGSHDTILFLVEAPRLPKIKITTCIDAATNENQ